MFVSMPQVLLCARLGDTHLSRTASLVIPTPYGVGGGQDARARVEYGCDAGLSDGNGLLLHSFVDSDTILISHLVKLIDANHTGVC